MVPEWVFAVWEFPNTDGFVWTPTAIGESSVNLGGNPPIFNAADK